MGRTLERRKWDENWTSKGRPLDVHLDRDEGTVSGPPEDVLRTSCAHWEQRSNVKANNNDMFSITTTKFLQKSLKIRVSLKQFFSGQEQLPRGVLQVSCSPSDASNDQNITHEDEYFCKAVETSSGSRRSHSTAMEKFNDLKIVSHAL